MNKRIILIALIVLVAGIGIYIYFLNSQNEQLNQSYTPCIVGSKTEFVLCSYNSYLNQNQMRGVIYNTTLIGVSKYYLNAYEYVQYWLNLSSFTLPSSYHLCVNVTKLDNSTENGGDLDLSEYNPVANTHFSCVSKIYTDSNHTFSNSGILPCMANEFPLVELYVFPSNFTADSITDFENNINTSQKIFAAYGVTAC